MDEKVDPNSPSIELSFNHMDKTKYYCSGFALYALTSFFANPFLQVKRRVQMGIEPTSAAGIWKSSGVHGLFRGGSLSWISGSNRMVYFTVYECFNSALQNHTKHYFESSSISNNLMTSIWAASSAAVASIVSQATLTPLHVVTTRMHINDGPPVSPLSIVKSIVSKYGRWSVLWTGYTSALVQAIPSNITLFSVYTFTKTHAQDLGLMNTPEMDLVTRFACSMMGTYASVVVTAPIDIARTFRQELLSSNSSSARTQGLSYSPNSSPSTLSATANSVIAHSVPPIIASSGGGLVSPPIPSTWRVLRDIYLEFGVRRIYAGASARLLSSTPYTLAMLIGYDYVKIYSTREDAYD